MSDVTELLDSLRHDESKATEDLLPLVYEELRKLAAHKMAHERPGQTLQPTALVHEVYLRLLGANPPQRWANCGHFFAAAAEAMRRILVEKARRRKTMKCGGQFDRVHLDAVELLQPMPDDQLLALDEALGRLATVDSRAAEVVKLCFFAGLTQGQAARELGVSVATAERLWAFARAWLFDEIQSERER